METPITIGVSACLLGENVRYNGGHSRDHFISDTLSQYVRFVPVCPEVECGFPIPREAFRLVGDPESPRFVTSRTGEDHTRKMVDWCSKKVKELEKEDLCGFVFKKGSPSSGMERVKVYTEKGMPSNRGVGMFARAFMEHFPLLPVEEDGRLHDPKLRENFIEGLFVMKRLRESLEPRPTRGAFVEFHTRHKLLIMSHSPKHMRLMGKMMADIKSHSLEDFRVEYQSRLMEALRLKTTRRKNTDVLFHVMGYFKKQITGDEKQELVETIENYRKGYVPLIVPATLLAHYVRKYDQAYLRDQFYLNPHPLELQLRNHA
ncbi:YbgA family protein [Thermodesulfobacteriota bacterium]